MITAAAKMFLDALPHYRLILKSVAAMIAVSVVSTIASRPVERRAIADVSVRMKIAVEGVISSP